MMIKDTLDNEEFHYFIVSNAIRHVTITPYRPASNWQAAFRPDFAAHSFVVTMDWDSTPQARSMWSTCLQKSQLTFLKQQVFYGCGPLHLLQCLGDCGRLFTCRQRGFQAEPS
ncbi:hypothetical protein Tsp_02343 [Trichinella spiralis]|uniref:hypothetical protein n=1 Tax=Trichinella spiralis TaxID=6334 RepID=UPI0001EFCEB9|nr:hypothetical protein Tsp_02343 [Trichinella spiralis]